MPYNSKAFGIIISRLRISKGITQERLAAFADIARSHLTALENGKKVARLDTFFRIAQALEISPTDLMRLTEQESARQAPD